MKTKYLFGMLLSGAMLAACTAEDDFKAPVAQDVNSSAPVFTVKFDGNNLKNRAEMNGKWQLGFEEGDLLSLYHGGTLANGDEGGLFDANGNHAIYEGHSEGEDGFTFTTKSMVKNNYAVLVYPADTTNIDPHEVWLTVDEDQDEATVKKTPYMSEILTIGGYSEHEENSEAGYGRNYDIALKRVGSTLSLNMNLKDTPDLSSVTFKKNGEDVPVPALELTKVALKEKNNTKVFTTGIKVMALGAPSVAYKAATTTSAGEHLSWEHQSDVYQTDGDIEKTAQLTTTDLKNGIATFTLLPSYEGTQISDLNGQVVVNTIYGKVTLKDETTMADAKAKDKIWHKAKGDDKDATLTAGLNDLLSNKVLWWPTDEKNSTFYKADGEGEKVGAHITRTLDVDMTLLDMGEIHIKNEDQLKAVIAVYNYLKDEELIVNTDGEVKFYLDGTNGTFEMHKEAWEAVVAQLNTKDNHVQFIPCKGFTTAENCTKVKLINDGDATEEVPELRFTTNAVDVELVGAWNYKSVAKAANDKRKNLANINKFIVDDNITLKGIVNAKDAVNTSKVVKFEVKAGATATVDGEVILEGQIENFGKIVIASSDLLRVGANGQLVNRESQGKNDDGWANADETKAGFISNAGVLGIVDDTNGVINNYGVIKVENGTARTLISNNGDKQDIKTVYNNGVSNTNPQHRIGSIYLFSATTKADNRTVVNAVKGFLKIKVNADNPSSSEGANKVGAVANYVILDKDCKSINGSLKTGTSIDYVEVIGGQELKIAASVSLKGLFVRNNSVIDIPQGSTLTVEDYMYLTEGKVYRAGGLTDGSTGGNTSTINYKGYYKGTDADQQNVTTYVVNN